MWQAPLIPCLHPRMSACHMSQVSDGVFLTSSGVTIGVYSPHILWPFIQRADTTYTMFTSLYVSMPHISVLRFLMALSWRHPASRSLITVLVYWCRWNSTVNTTYTMFTSSFVNMPHVCSQVSDGSFVTSSASRSLITVLMYGNKTKRGFFSCSINQPALQTIIRSIFLSSTASLFPSALLHWRWIIFSHFVICIPSSNGRQRQESGYAIHLCGSHRRLDVSYQLLQTIDYATDDQINHRDDGD